MTSQGAVAGVACASALFGAGFWSSYLVARRLDRDAPAHVRLCATTLLVCWLLTASFRALAALHLFRLWVALPMWLVTAAVAHWLLDGRSAWRQAALDCDRALVLGRALRGTWARPLLAVGGACLLLRLARGLVAPPLGGDAIIYHLVKPGRWLQAGGLTGGVGPDWWSFWRYYADGSEILWAWAMLPVHGDALLAPAGLMVWAGCAAAAYAAARSLGAAVPHATFAAMAIGFTPTTMAFLTAAHAETTLLLYFLTAVLFIQRWTVRHRPADGLLAAAALGLLAGVKPVGLPALLVGAIVITLHVRQWPATVICRAGLLLGGAAIASAGLADYFRAWAETGSPLHPLPLVLLGRTLLPGNQEFALLFSGKLFPPAATVFAPSSFARHLGLGPLGHGPFGLVVAALALSALPGLVRRPQTAPVSVFMVAAAGLSVAFTFSENMRAQWTVGAFMLGRHLVAPAAAAALLGAGRSDGLSLWVLRAAALVGVAYSIPVLAWGTHDAAAVIQLLAALALAAAVGGALLAWSRARRRGPGAVLPAAVAVLAAAALVVHWADLRGRFRHRFYRAADAEEAFDAHLISVPGWPVAQHLDGGPGHRIAATAGWDGHGANWAQYPLLGSRLQNAVVYVPVTREGDVIDYRRRDEVERRADLGSWLRRLREQRIDVVVDLGAAPIEARWMAAHPETFVPLARAARGGGGAYRLRPPAPALAGQP